MRTSVAISLVILAMAAGLGWHLGQRLAAARTLSGKLVSAAKRSGISIDTSNPANSLRITRRPREIGDDPVQLAADFIAVSKDLEMLRTSRAKQDDALLKRNTDLWKRMRLLEFNRAKILITELHANENLAKDYCQSAISSLLKDLVVDRPQAVLDLLMESPDLLPRESCYSLIDTALTGWSKDSPLAAFEWAQKNGGLFPNETTLTLKRGVVYGVAAKDPKLAFDLLRRSGIEDTRAIAGGIMAYPRTPETRTAALTAYRGYFADLEDVKGRKYAGMLAVGNLTDNLARDGFAAATQWLADAKLTPDELRYFADHLPSSAKAGERGKWIDWIGKTLPPDKAAGCIWQNVKDWTEADYQAAGKWLATTSDGPTKNAAIRAYAGSVASFEPETATQWALTLPQGKDREQTLATIYQKWPRGDDTSKAAAEAFKADHHIK